MDPIIGINALMRWLFGAKDVVEGAEDLKGDLVGLRGLRSAASAKAGYWFVSALIGCRRQIAFRFEGNTPRRLESTDLGPSASGLRPALVALVFS